MPSLLTPMYSRFCERWSDGPGMLRSANHMGSSYEEADLRYRRPYQTRHTYALMMLSAGEHPMWVAKQTKHSDWAMVARVYGRSMHLSIERLVQKRSRGFPLNSANKMIKNRASVDSQNEGITMSSTENTPLKKAISASLATMTITAAVVSFFFDKYVVPLAVLQTKNEFTELSLNSKKNEAENIQLKDELSRIQAELKAKKEEASATKQKLVASESGNLFLQSNPYPVGFGRIRIGDKVEALNEAYALGAITWPNEDDGAYKAEVKIQNSVFSAATYTYDPKTRKIIAVGFRANYETPRGLLLDKLSDTFGIPIPSKPKGMYKWPISSKINTFLMTDTFYLIVSSERAPLLWTQD
jgi:hypothetical protein